MSTPRAPATVTPSDPCALMVVIPARNEESTVGAVIAEVRETRAGEVVVIDDVSIDATGRIATDAGATVLPLRVHLGAWGATQTGLRYALRRHCATVVTMDADGQHLAPMISRLLAPIAAGRADVVIGAYPERASRGRRLAWSAFRALTGFALEDLTSGFRAYNRRAVELLAAADATLLDHQDVGVLLHLRLAGLRIEEVPVTMRPRSAGHSRVFHSWLSVINYLLQTGLLCLARWEWRPSRHGPQ